MDLVIFSAIISVLVMYSKPREFSYGNLFLHPFYFCSKDDAVDPSMYMATVGALLPTFVKKFAQFIAPYVVNRRLTKFCLSF